VILITFSQRIEYRGESFYDKTLFTKNYKILNHCPRLIYMLCVYRILEYKSFSGIMVAEGIDISCEQEHFKNAEIGEAP